jgi:anti-sigma28 factor (negative regulator of flagellin synthesis)
MNNVNGVQPPWAPGPVEPTNPVVPNTPTTPPAGVSDVVEISAAAELAAKIQEIPDVRADLVARVKQEIEAGTYETPERIEAAVNKLLDDLFPELL